MVDRFDIGMDGDMEIDEHGEWVHSNAYADLRDELRRVKAAARAEREGHNNRSMRIEIDLVDRGANMVLTDPTGDEARTVAYGGAIIGLLMHLGTVEQVGEISIKGGDNE